MELLKDLGHARSGDKTGAANIGVIVNDHDDFERVGRALRSDRLRTVLGLSESQVVEVFELPNLNAFNVLLPGVLKGAPTYTLSFDVFGHYLGMRVLALEIDDE